MNEEIKEIKEILDNTLEYLEGIDETRNTKILTTNETYILLDYITNLQEENKELLERFSNKIEEVSDLIKENEKLKLARDTKCASEILCECLNNVYKSRNEKAIEYIDTHYLNANEPELLNILNGGDE